jgi:hypothetical protein
MPRILSLISACALSIAAASCSPQPRFKTVATVKQLMEATIHPAAEVLFDSVGTIISLEGTEEIAPKNDGEWARVGYSALTLAESANLLMIGGRAADQGDWITFSREMVDAGVAAMKAVEAKNPEALFEAGGQVYAVCARCHEKYADHLE